MTEKTYIVYQHTSPSGKIYIGITKHSDKPNNRWKNGKGYRKNKHFTSAINLYGWDNFKHEILYTGLTVDEAGRRERILIRLYNTTDSDFGYNCSDGGENGNPFAGKSEDEKVEFSKKISIATSGENNPFFGKHHSEETRRKQSKAKIGKYCGESNPLYGKKSSMAGANHPFYGKHHTEEAKEKMRKAKTGNNNIRARAVYCLTTSEMFSTRKEGEKKYNVDGSSITRCCQGKLLSAGKLPDGTPMRWQYYEDYIKEKESEVA